MKINKKPQNRPVVTKILALRSMHGAGDEYV